MPSDSDLSFRLDVQYVLPNDVTFAVTGTVTAGSPDPPMRISVEISTPTGWIEIVGQVYGTVPAGQSRFLNATMTRTQILAITGPGLPSGPLTAQGKVVLQNLSGVGPAIVTLTSIPVTFILN